jgi:DNA-binding NtrC family response regulator
MKGVPGGPRHFHLLWDEDIEQLRGIFRSIMERSDEIVRYWYQLYVLHFGDERTLSQAEFTRIFEPGLRRNKVALLEGNMDDYAQQVIRLGELLAERHVPLEEIIASLHLFEESAQIVFPPDAPTSIYTSFDKLSHVRIILLVSAYFRSHSAAARERIFALEREASQLEHDVRTRFRGLVGGSEAMRRLYTRIEAAGATANELLIVGEKGTGKEMAARAIHESGAGDNAPFIVVNCAAIPASLIASELFGYRREAVGAAAADYLGLLRAANQGTLYLNEVSALGLSVQDEILRVLREQTVRPVGAQEQYPVHVRVIAATSQDPQTSVKEGKLRANFVDRFRTSVIEVPPLSARRDDIPVLVEHFISVLRERSGRPVFGTSEQAMNALLIFDWPGNVRQLGEHVEAAFNAASGTIIERSDLPSPRVGPGPIPPEAASLSPRGRARPNLASFVDLERDLIQRALESTSGNKTKAAKLLKISRRKLDSRLEKFHL